MRVVLGSALVGSALLLLNIATVQAADLSYKDSVNEHITKSTWYTRIDGSYGLHHDPDMTEGGGLEHDDPSYDPAWSLGGGLGRYFTRSLRGDITYDYRFETDISGTMSSGTSGNGFREFGLTSHVLLANLYYDFNRHGRINPYIGLGLGVVYHDTEERTLPANCTCTATIGEGSDWHFAGAVMAGVAMTLRDQLKLDLGYRFLYLGEVETGSVQADSASPVGTISSGISAEDLYAHEFRIGLRYDIH